MIELNNVSMSFRTTNDRITSLKEYVIKKMSGKIEHKVFQALNEISFSIEKGEVVGILGENGAGKSTLLKIISGILSPTQGNVQVKGTIAPLLELGAGFDVDLTAKENVFLNGAVLGYSKQYLKDRYQEIVDFAELHDFMETPVRNLSSGMTMRLAFSIATLVDPDILIVDEILSVGDAHFQAKSAARMKELINSGATVILVSHSIQQIREICSKAVWLDHGALKMAGNVSEVCDAYMSYMKRKENSSIEETQEVDIDLYKKDLYSPTSLVAYDNQYFIVDCWHHRVIYNDNLTDPIDSWTTLDDRLYKPHSLVSDGEVFIVESTAKDELKVYVRNKDGFLLKQTLKGIGSQPNRIVYDPKRQLFYGISASSQQVFVLKNVASEVEILKVIELSYLKNAYVRSISIIEDKLYFVSGPGKIVVTSLDSLSFDLLQEYPVPFELQGMNDIIKFGMYYYISSYQNGKGDITPKVVRVKALERLTEEYEDLYDLFELRGVPYHFFAINEQFFLTEIDSFSSIISFTLEDDKIQNVKRIYDSGNASPSSIRRSLK